jgi:uncharacterized protein YjiS (DUF1127 family)
MTAATAAFFAPAHHVAARSEASLARRLLDALVALDAGHRAASKLATASDERLADMGITRAEAETFGRRSGPAAPRRPQVFIR